jgi:hypothetical protein
MVSRPLSEFKIFHDYNKLVRRGAAEPLTCEACHTTYVVSIGANDEPILKCFVCNTQVRPGLRVKSEMRRIIDEYFER